MGWVLDLDGVVWLADRPIEGAAQAVARLRDRGERIAFVTNMSWGRVGEVAAKLEAHGIDPGDDVITSAMAAAELVSAGERVLVVGGPGLHEAVSRRGAIALVARDGAGVEAGAPEGAVGADAVLVGYDPGFDYATMSLAARAVREGARLLASNDDSTYPTPNGPLPGGGAILASVEKASGLRAEVAGKPHPPVCELVRAHVGEAGIVVGDRPDTDGRFARALGARFGLVLSGVTRPRDLPVTPEPDVVAEDLAALVEAELG